MKHDIIRRTKVVTAINPIYATTGHATTATEVNATGWSRALWIIQVGAMAATAVVEMEVQASATTSTGFADVTSAALTDISSAGANKVYLIEHAVSPSKPYLKLAGTCGTARATVAATCVLYEPNGLNRVTIGAGQIVDL